MVDRSFRWLRVAVGGCLLVALVGCTVSLDGVAAAGPMMAVRGPAVDVVPPLRVLQLNLCGSGFAPCFTGHAVAAAADLIRAEHPDVVTLNEVCTGDVARLRQALAGAGTTVVSAFRAARDRRTGEGYRCRNGQEYGIGVVSRLPAVPGASAVSGIYPTQDPGTPEERAWLCLDVVAGKTVAFCTTHLANADRAVAVAQCRYLLGTVLAERDTPLVLGADLNLGPAESPDLRSCVPAGPAQVDDGGEQHVVVTSGFAVEDTRTLGLGDATDHPGLLVALGSADSSVRGS